MNTPPLSEINWPESYRIISSIHPPIDLFEDLADPADWEALARLESKTNPRILENVGQLRKVPVHRRVSGPGASYLMAPFTHVNPRWTGRFHDGIFGAYYCAKELETALAETIFHRSKLYRASREAPGWFSQYRALVASVHQRFHDLRGQSEFSSCLQPDDYRPSQALAQSLRAADSSGIVYPSVRYDGGTCLAAFWPDVVSIPIQGAHFAYHFDGERIDMYRNEATGQVFRVLESPEP